MSLEVDRLRIAVALTALKFKPAEQSFASYVLDLRSKFPPSIPCAPTADGSWRTHALTLEKELTVLRDKYEAERIKSISLAKEAETAAAAASVAQEAQKDVSDAPTNVPSKKKAKAKKAQAVNPDSDALRPTEPEAGKCPPRLDLRAILGDSNTSKDIDNTSFPKSYHESLFSSFSSFEQLVSALPRTLTTSQETLLLSSTIRALDALSRVLQGVFASFQSNFVAPCSDGKTLHTINVLLTHLLSTCFQLLFPARPDSGDSGTSAQKKPVKKKKKNEETSKSTSAPDHSLDSFADDLLLNLPGEQTAPPSFVKLLDALLELVLQPLLHAFVPLSEAYLSSVLGATSDPPTKLDSRKEKNGKGQVKSTTTNDRDIPNRPLADVRPDVLCLFRSAFAQISRLVALCHSPGVAHLSGAHYVSGVRECLSLAAVRELFRVFECLNCIEPCADHPDIHPFPPIARTSNAVVNKYNTSGTLGMSKCMHADTLRTVPEPPPLRGPCGEKSTDAEDMSNSRNSATKAPGREKLDTPTAVSRRHDKDVRLRRLVRKDAVWYLSTVLHVLFDNAYFSEPYDACVLPASMSKSDPKNSSLGCLDASSSSGQTSEYPRHEASKERSALGPEVPSWSNPASLSSSPNLDQRNRPLTSAEKEDCSDVYRDVSEAEASVSSLALLRQGMLESLSALVVLAMNCRPFHSSKLGNTSSPTCMSSTVPSTSAEKDGDVLEDVSAGHVAVMYNETNKDKSQISIRSPSIDKVADSVTSTARASKLAERRREFEGDRRAGSAINIEDGTRARIPNGVLNGDLSAALEAKHSKRKALTGDNSQGSLQLLQSIDDNQRSDYLDSFYSHCSHSTPTSRRNHDVFFPSEASGREGGSRTARAGSDFDVNAPCANENGGGEGKAVAGEKFLRAPENRCATLMDEVEYDMVLGVIEKYWECTTRSRGDAV